MTRKLIICNNYTTQSAYVRTSKVFKNIDDYYVLGNPIFFNLKKVLLLNVYVFTPNVVEFLTNTNKIVPGIYFF